MKKKLWLWLIPALVVPLTSPLSFGAEEKPEERIGDLRREGIDVVQGRAFRKAMRHEFTVDGGMIPNNQFLFYETGSARYTFHFREGLGFEASYTRGFHQEKSIIADLRSIPCENNNVDIDGDGDPEPDTDGDGRSNCPVELENPPDPLKNAYFGNVVWSPIYGKFALFSKKILHFDLFFTAGAGLFDNERSNRFAFSVGTGLKVFANDFIAVRAEFRNITVREGAPFSNIVNNGLFLLGASIFLPFKPIDR